MYTNVFLVSDGCLTFDVLGTLQGMDKQLSRAIIWNCGGTGSLIIFLKCLGFTWEQMVSKLTLLKCLPNIVYGGCLEPGVSLDIKMEIVTWLTDIINSKKMFSEDTTLKEIYKLTRIFPNILTSKGSINPKSHPDVTLVDSVLTSMCNFGVYDKHIIDGEEYTSFSKYNPFPLESQVILENIPQETLYLVNYSKLFNNEVYSVFDGIENRLVQEYFDRIYRIATKNTKDHFILVNGIFSKSEIEGYDVEHRVESGNLHSTMFLNEESTLKYMETIINKIKNQS